MATASKVFRPSGQVWFTADTHFGHALMLKKGRNFATTDDMDEALIAIWNSVVDKQDTVFHLGDFAFKQHNQRVKSIFGALNGHKHLVIGNHDFGDRDVMHLPWATPPEHRRFIKIGDDRIVLDHYAGRTWAGSYRGAIQLFGHSHGQMPATDKSCDVGVDAWNLTPVGLDELKAFLALQPKFHNEDPGEEVEIADNFEVDHTTVVPK